MPNETDSDCFQRDLTDLVHIGIYLTTLSREVVKELPENGQDYLARIHRHLRDCEDCYYRYAMVRSFDGMRNTFNPLIMILIRKNERYLDKHPYDQ